MIGLFKRKIANRPLFLGANENTTTYIGHDTKGRPIGTTSKQMRGHVLLTGTTGAGKTEALLSLMSNAFATGSGGVLVDGKGDVSVYAKMFAMADYFDRRDDLYVINFMTGHTTAVPTLQRSHRFNPFEKGSPDVLAGVLTKMFEDPTIPSMWTGRASAMTSGLMRMLCWLRDEKGRYLDVAVIRDSISFQALFDLAYSDEFADAPVACRAPLRAYLSSLGAVVERGYDQNQETLTQQAYIEMQLTRSLGLMADVYEHIFAAGGTDIDIEDIVKNRRFLLVMLPALEKSQDEIALLGKIVVAALQAMAGSLLWTNEASAEVAKEVGLVPDESDTLPPFLCILDEATYYAVSGFDLLAAQVRSLGIALVISCQDIQSLFHTNNQVARAILACTATKIIMRTECWHPELDDMIVSAEAGRDDVIPAISRHSSRSLFNSARRFAAGQSEGEFVLLNSGKMIIGRSIYFTIREVKHLVLSVPRFRCVQRAADTLLSLVDEKKADDDTMIPRIVKKLAESGDSSATDMLSSALAGLHSPAAARAPVIADVVRMGE